MKIDASEGFVEKFFERLYKFYPLLTFHTVYADTLLGISKMTKQKIITVLEVLITKKIVIVFA